MPGSRWAAVADDGERSGLALITEANTASLPATANPTVSLLRGARITDGTTTAAPRQRPESAPAYLATHRSGQACAIRLAVGVTRPRGRGGTAPGRSGRHAFATPLKTVRMRWTSAGRAANACTRAQLLDARNWLRLHEVSGERGTATSQLAPGWKAQPCALDNCAYWQDHMRPIAPANRERPCVAALEEGRFEIVAGGSCDRRGLK